jgi:hypothetical protein
MFSKKSHVERDMKAFEKKIKTKNKNLKRLQFEENFIGTKNETVHI